MQWLKKWGAAVLFCITASVFAQMPEHYPANYQRIVDAAKKEGRLVLYATADHATARPLVQDFESMYGIKVIVNNMNSTELYNRFISENAANSTSADVVWSSGMDLQIKLVEDGLMDAYASPESVAVPAWANYKNQAYGTTFEPVVIIYNKRLLPPAQVPQTRADLIKLLQSDPARFKGRLITYDIEKAGAGFNNLAQDARINLKLTWDVVKAIGATRPKLQSSTGAIMERVSSGESILGYNILGAYAVARAEKSPSLGYAFLKDYTLVISRVVSISKRAKYPNAARLWVDYLLSKRGQNIIANQSKLYSIREDVKGETSMAGLREELGDALKPVPIDADLLKYLDRTRRLAFIKQWRDAIRR